MKRLSAFFSFMPLMLSVIANAQIDGYQVKGQVIDRQIHNRKGQAWNTTVHSDSDGIQDGRAETLERHHRTGAWNYC